MHGVDLTCIGYGVFCGEQKNMAHQQKTKKAKIKQNSMLDVGWKVSIKAKVDNLVARMAKSESMVDSMAEIKTMLTQMQYFEH
jgi:uncharacterized protein YhjY with autotransporter beta-barrel domain